MIKGLEALNEIKDNCRCYRKGNEIIELPFSKYEKNRYEIIEKELKAFNNLYDTIKQKRNNAQLEYEHNKDSMYLGLQLRGQIAAYNDILSLMEVNL